MRTGIASFFFCKVSFMKHPSGHLWNGLSKIRLSSSNPDSISRTFLEQLVFISDWSWIQRIWTGHCCAQLILCRHYSIWLKHYLFQNRHHGKHLSFYRVWENCEDDLVWLLCQLWRNLWSLSWDQLRLYRGNRVLVLNQALQKLQSLKSTYNKCGF